MPSIESDATLAELKEDIFRTLNILKREGSIDMFNAPRMIHNIYGIDTLVAEELVFDWIDRWL